MDRENYTVICRYIIRILYSTLCFCLWNNKFDLGHRKYVNEYYNYFYNFYSISLFASFPYSEGDERCIHFSASALRSFETMIEHMEKSGIEIEIDGAYI